jgi:hypothetical protein
MVRCRSFAEGMSGFGKDRQLWPGLVLPGQRRSIQNRQKDALISAKGWVVDHLIFTGSYAYNQAMTVKTRCEISQIYASLSHQFRHAFNPFPHFLRQTKKPSQLLDQNT